MILRFRCSVLIEAGGERFVGDIAEFRPILTAASDRHSATGGAPR
jgi:hypothetical protein